MVDALVILSSTDFAPLKSFVALGLRLRQGPSAKGPAKKRESVTPVVGGWVRVRKRVGVGFIFPIFFLIVFLNSAHRETPKNVIKRIQGKKKSVFGFLVEFFVQTFRKRFFCDHFYEAG
jgi:hypothetical protein